MKKRDNGTDKTYKKVTDKVIELIEKNNTLPWSKPWATSSVRPMNYTNKRPYNGINAFICSFFNSPYFMTFKQVKDMGGNVKKGASSIPVTYWQFLEFDENGKITKDRSKSVKTIPFFKYFNVFNEEDIEGIDFDDDYKVVPIGDANEIIAKCEEIVSNQKDLKIIHRDNSAYYSPLVDHINMPTMDMFKSSEYYYSVLFHEMAHWTGHESRLDRFEGTSTQFGSATYSKEELIAEMSACFICTHAGVSNEDTMRNSAAYIKGWVSKLKKDPKLISTAATKAQKVFEYITQYETEVKLVDREEVVTNKQ